MASLPRVLVAQQVYPDGGGISSILENLVLELEGRYELHVAIVEERAGRRDSLALPEPQVHVLGYSNAINPMVFPTSLVYAARVGRFLRGVVQQIEPALLAVQDGLNLPVPGLIATAGTGVPLAVLDHGTLTNVHEDGWMRMVAARLDRPRALAFAAGFVADAPWRALRWRLGRRFADELWYTGVELEPWFGPAGDRAREYAQMVPLDFSPPSPEERAAARRHFDLDPDRVAISMVGRLDGEKGLDTVLDAVERQPLAGADLLVAGDGSLRDWMESEISRRGLDSQVRLTGRLDRDEVRRIQHASDFHLYAGTISCGVSICLLEAMACGVVPVVSDVPAAQRGLVGEAGWVFPAGNAEALADALRDALSMTPAERGRRGELAERRVRSAQERGSIPQLIQGLATEPPAGGRPGRTAIGSGSL